MEIRLGIIGVGSMGLSHARNVAAGACARVRLAAVCDTDPARLAAAPEAPRFADSRALIRSGLVDAVLVATPHYAHTTIGIDALGQGLHLLTEKPISVHVADCRRLIAAYEARPRPQQVFAAMFQERTFPRYRALRQLVQSGELGRIQRVAWTTTDWCRSDLYYRSGGWRASWAGEGGGVLTNQCPHRLDLLQWIFGSPARITARAGFGRFHDIEVEDEVQAFLDWEDGATGTFITTTGEAPGVNRLEVACDRGLVVLEDGVLRWRRTVQPVTDWVRHGSERFDGPGVWEVSVPTPGTTRQHADIIQNFADAILDGTPLIAPASEGIRAVEIANAMILSARTRQPVDLPLDADAYLRMHDELVRGSRWRATASAGGAA